MTSPHCDQIHVPLSPNTPPYRIDLSSNGDCCVRIRRRGPDLLVLVPPGDVAPEFRSRVIAELRAYAVRNISPRRFGQLVFGLFHPGLRLTASYPVDPAAALRDMPASGLRYLMTDELRGGPAVEALRRTLLDSPAALRPEERSALWVLAARDEFYASALSATRRLAELRFQETVRSRARGFSVEMQVALDELESEGTLTPPTSAW